ncbi:hypothetical protein HanPSC8_Chr03g0086621 [Helianthus annuus]|nr:hypothetical protein HanPSC8_Chr03g0086621 [Helianthus annuus]
MSRFRKKTWNLPTACNIQGFVLSTRYKCYKCLMLHEIAQGCLTCPKNYINKLSLNIHSLKVEIYIF